MIKQDIVNRVAKRMAFTKVKAEMAVDAVFDSFKSALRRGERIELRGFGVFIVKRQKNGVGRNPKTGEEARFRRAIRFVSNQVKRFTRTRSLLTLGTDSPFFQSFVSLFVAWLRPLKNRQPPKTPNSGWLLYRRVA